MSVVQESGVGLAEWFWLRVSHEVAVRCGPGLESSEGLTGARGLLPSWPLTWLEVGANHWQETLLPLFKATPQAFLSVLLAWCQLPQSKWFLRLRWKPQSLLWMLHIVTSAVFDGSHRPALQYEQRLHRMWTLGGKDTCGVGEHLGRWRPQIRCCVCAYDFLILRKRHVKMKVIQL